MPMLQTALRGRHPSAFYCTNARERQCRKIDKIFQFCLTMRLFILMFAVQCVIRSNVKINKSYTDATKEFSSREKIILLCTQREKER